MTETTQTVGVALGGGAARALAHIGSFKALETCGFAPDVLAGTSSGALMGALYALEPSGTTLEKWALEQDNAAFWANAFDFGLHRASLVHGQKFHGYLERTYFHGATFGDLELPLAIACTDFDTGKLVVLKEGNVARAIQASCAFPGFFAAVRWEGQPLGDGGLVATVPFAALDGFGVDVRIGLHAGVPTDSSQVVAALRHWQASERGKRLQGLLLSFKGDNPYAGLLRGLARVQTSYEQGISAPEGAHLISTNPPIAWWDFHEPGKAIAAGERVTRAALEKLIQLGGVEKVNF